MKPAIPAQQAQRASRRRRIAARRCAHCQAMFARRVVEHPAGRVVVCAACGHLEPAARRLAVIQAAG